MGKAGEESFRELYSTSSKSRLAIAGPARAWEKCEERPEASRVPALERGSILPDAAWPLLTAPTNLPHPENERRRGSFIPGSVMK